MIRSFIIRVMPTVIRVRNEGSYEIDYLYIKNSKKIGGTIDGTFSTHTHTREGFRKMLKRGLAAQLVLQHWEA